ncbi:MAG: tetratricopeptide repeat protein, partial [Candidatus Thermoplasmatota archaeon]
GRYEDAVSAYDEAIKLDARDKAYWNSKGLALLHLKRLDDAKRCFEAALALDADYEPALEGRKAAEERVHAAQIEAHAERVVTYEKHMGRPATREEIFKYCSVPLDTLDEVIKYVNEPAPLALERLPPEELRKYEAVGSAVLSRHKNLDAIRLTDVAEVLPHVDLDEARSIWGYLDWVRDAPLEPTPEWHNDDLIRQALDLPKEEWNLVDLARELRLGPFEAKKLEVSLKIFQGGGYRIHTKPAPGIPKPRKAKPEARPAPAVKPGGKDDEDEEADEEDEASSPAKKPAKAKPPEDEGPNLCSVHHFHGVEKHACGTWLCKACVEGGEECQGCHEPLGHAPRKPAKDREADPARDFTRL